MSAGGYVELSRALPGVGYSETGSWLGSSLTGWTYASPTRYAACNSAGNTASWVPTIGAAGTYQV